MLNTFDTRLQKIHPRSRFTGVLISIVTVMEGPGNTDLAKINGLKLPGKIEVFNMWYELCFLIEIRKKILSYPDGQTAVI